MCCDGALFHFALLQEEEKDAAVSLGLIVVEMPGRTCFQQPCAVFRNGRCSVYEQRPNVCRGFECKLLQSCRAGKINLEEGLNKVHQAREMLFRVASLMPPRNGAGISLREIKAQMGLLSSAGEAERRQHLQFLMEAAKYQMLLRTNFLPNRMVKRAPSDYQPEMTV
jgi:hypothetical protein